MTSAGDGAGTTHMIQTITHNFPPFVVDIIRLCAWLAILTAIFVPLERVFALHPSKILRKGISTDLGYYFLGGLVTSVLLSVPLGVIAWTAHRFVPHVLQTAFDGVSFWPRALAGLVAGEIGFYWGHRLMHTVPFLWRFHAIHHSAEHIDFLVNSRAHPVDLTFGRLCAFVPLYVLGIAQPGTTGGSMIPALVTLVGTTWAFFIHTNIWWRLGPLEWVISTPHFHHWHHAMEPANRNYASMLPVLDRVFGSLHLPKGEWPEGYGIHDTMPATLGQQLLQPFLPKRLAAVAVAPGNPDHAERPAASSVV
jgi:sterol desaturase/sphingolipid hydroxylase (fatty acid hydroxylase superfamily)